MATNPFPTNSNSGTEPPNTSVTAAFLDEKTVRDVVEPKIIHELEEQETRQEFVTFTFSQDKVEKIKTEISGLVSREISRILNMPSENNLTIDQKRIRQVFFIYPMIDILSEVMWESFAKKGVLGLLVQIDRLIETSAEKSAKDREEAAHDIIKNFINSIFKDWQDLVVVGEQLNNVISQGLTKITTIPTENKFILEKKEIRWLFFLYPIIDVLSNIMPNAQAIMSALTLLDNLDALIDAKEIESTEREEQAKNIVKNFISNIINKEEINIYSPIKIPSIYSWDKDSLIPRKIFSEIVRLLSENNIVDAKQTMQDNIEDFSKQHWIYELDRALFKNKAIPKERNPEVLFKMIGLFNELKVPFPKFLVVRPFGFGRRNLIQILVTKTFCETYRKKFLTSLPLQTLSLKEFCTTILSTFQEKNDFERFSSIYDEMYLLNYIREDYQVEGCTIKNFCQLAKYCGRVTYWVFPKFVSLVNDPKINAEHRQTLLNQFFEGADYAELMALSPEMIHDAIKRFLPIIKDLNPIPKIVSDFVKHYISEKYFNVPACLYKLWDLSEAFVMSYFDTPGNCVIFSNGEEPYEGAFAKDDKEIYAAASEKKPGTLDPKLSLPELRAFILEKRAKMDEELNHLVSLAFSRIPEKDMETKITTELQVAKITTYFTEVEKHLAKTMCDSLAKNKILALSQAISKIISTNPPDKKDRIKQLAQEFVEKMMDYWHYPVPARKKWVHQKDLIEVFNYFQSNSHNYDLQGIAKVDLALIKLLYPHATRDQLSTLYRIMSNSMQNNVCQSMGFSGFLNASHILPLSNPQDEQWDSGMSLYRLPVIPGSYEDPLICSRNLTLYMDQYGYMPSKYCLLRFRNFLELFKNKLAPDLEQFKSLWNELASMPMPANAAVSAKALILSAPAPRSVAATSNKVTIHIMKP